MSRLYLEENNLSSPASLLNGIKTTNEMDELLCDELFGHDQLQLGKISPLLFRHHRHHL